MLFDTSDSKKSILRHWHVLVSSMIVHSYMKRNRLCQLDIYLNLLINKFYRRIQIYQYTCSIWIRDHVQWYYIAYMNCQLSDIFNTGHCSRRAFKKQYNCYNLVEIDVSVNAYTCYISAEIQDIIQKINFIRAFRNEYTCYYLTEIQGIVPESWFY